VFAFHIQKHGRAQFSTVSQDISFGIELTLTVRAQCKQCGLRDKLACGSAHAKKIVSDDISVDIECLG
jgi:hypothetical protein